jgi:hypothetical protein
VSVIAVEVTDVTGFVAAALMPRPSRCCQDGPTWSAEAVWPSPWPTLPTSTMRRSKVTGLSLT